MSQDSTSDDNQRDTDACHSCAETINLSVAPDSTDAISSRAGGDWDAAACSDAADRSSIDSDSHATACTGSGASWGSDKPKATELEGLLRQNWARAMALARAAQQPIRFFHQGSTKQPQSQPDSTDVDNTAANEAQSAYSPYPVITTEPFARAWRQASQTASDLLLSAKFAAPSDFLHAPAKALHSVQAGTQQPFSVLKQSWTATAGYLSDVQAAVVDGAKRQAGSMASRLDAASQVVSAEAGRLLHWPWSSSPQVSADLKVHICL